ncbi:Rz1 family lipoprotein, partial [Morganella morganii]|nr:Rz1 family lipoprotein [Morganella morganii]
MPKLKLIVCVMLLSLALSACTSKPSVQRPEPIPPPAWMMADPPPWRETLNRIIFISLNSLKHSRDNIL